MSEIRVEPKFVAIINDCQDGNARARQEVTVGSLFNINPAFVGVETDLEASANLVDLIDASRGEPGIILVNKAPRNGKAKEHKNGTPFGYFWHGDTLVVSSTDGLALSLPKKLGITAVVNELDIETTIEDVLEATGESNEEGLARRITNTQFRSLAYTPRAARALWSGVKLASEEKVITRNAGHKTHAWHVDNFGNIKTTGLPTDIGFDPEQGDGYRVSTALGEVSCYGQLRSVPENGELAVTIGSSGYKDQNFLELVIQGGSAVKKLSSHTQIHGRNLIHAIA